MKSFCLALSLLAAMSISGFAQTPSIAGIVMNSTGSTTLSPGAWWQIHGTNLSTCTQTTGPMCSYVSMLYDAMWLLSNGSIITGNSRVNYHAQSTVTPGWYESPVQINVHPLVVIPPTPNPIGTLIGYGAGLWVCNSLSNCSTPVNITF